MPIETDLNVAPYFNDYSEEKNDVRILWKPNLAVQVRELNQLQDILQKQIERFGDSIYQSGSIVEGCNFSFMDVYPYVKILDSDVLGESTTASDYLGLFVTNASGLRGYVINYSEGFESTAPDLKTIYVKYINAGNDGNTHAFAPADQLTVTDANVSIFRVTANNGGVSFANSDAVIFTSAVAVNVSSGSFNVSDYVTQGVSNLQITSIDSNTLASTGEIILGLKPRDVDLANSDVNSSRWTLISNSSIQTTTNSAVGTVTQIFGESAGASITTDGAGRIVTVKMTNQGAGYYVLPVVRVRSPNNSGGLATLDLIPQNYKTKLKVANTVDSVGNGYGFAISNGIIYQKGMFLRVKEQSIIVSKYDQMPSNVAVGFDSIETIVDANVDSTLYDNAAGFPNYQAPGADRLRVDPILVLANTEDIDSSFLKICVWSEGVPYQQNPTSVYSEIGDEMAKRTKEVSGNFSIDRFQVTTKSPANNALEGNTISIVVDPGKAYIDGYRVETTRNFAMDIKKATDSFFSNNYSISLNYGNWIRVKNFGGSFQFSTGDIVYLYPLAASFISNGYNSAISVTTPLGLANIRSVVWESGTPGTPEATYKLFLFNIQMYAGKNFEDIRSISWYDHIATTRAIGDVVTELSPTTGKQIAKLSNTEFDSLIFRSGVDSLKNAANTNFIYRTQQTAALTNTGVISYSVSSDPYASYLPKPNNAMTSADLKNLIVTSSQSLAAQTAVTGTLSVSTTSPNVTGTSTTFVTDFRVGDYVNLYANASTQAIRRVQNIVNNTVMIMDANNSYSSSSVSGYRAFPAYVPIPFGTRSGLSGNVSTNGSVMTLNFGTNLQITGGSANLTIAVDVAQIEAPAGTKQAVRDQFVKISAANNADGRLGPWCLGVPDAFRLKKVYSFSNSSVNTSSTDVTNYFYIDSNQSEDFLDLSYLYVQPTSGYSVGASDWLLVQFDYFSTPTKGFYNSTSYLSANLTTITTTDSLSLANLGSSINSFEVPEVYTAKGEYYDLLNCIDFRPIAANTVAPSSSASGAPINPTYSLSFGDTSNPTNIIKFPTPDSFFTSNIEFYGTRVDSVFVAKDGNIFTISGNPAKTGAELTTPNQPSGTMKLNDLLIPSYPNLPMNLSNQMKEILTKRIANERNNQTRNKAKQITTQLPPNVIETQQPTAYTQADIGNLDRRLKAVEYYIGLSALETDMVNKVVLSSDGETTRFKFGLFVDSFETAVSQDSTNPAYAASLVNTMMAPPYFQWGVDYADSAILSQPYIDYKLIDQNNATYPEPPPPPIVEPPPVVEPPPPTPNTTPNTVIVTPPVITTPVVVPPPPPIVVPPPAPTIYNGSLVSYRTGPSSEFPNHPAIDVYGLSAGDNGNPATQIIYDTYTSSGIDAGWAGYNTGMSGGSTDQENLYNIPCYWVVTGLKPNTTHRFYINGVDATSESYPASAFFARNQYGVVNMLTLSSTSHELTTDASGHLAFVFYLSDYVSGQTFVGNQIPWDSLSPVSRSLSALTGTTGNKGTYGSAFTTGNQTIHAGNVLCQLVATNSTAQTTLELVKIVRPTVFTGW